MQTTINRMFKISVAVLLGSMLPLAACSEMMPSGSANYSSARNSAGADAGSNQGEDAGASEDGGRSWFQLSPDDSTSMASAQLLKSESRSWAAIHSHEVINYYDPPAALRSVEALPQSWTTDDGIFIGVDGEEIMAVDDGDEALDLLIHIYAPQKPVEERRAWNLHLCVDVSGSMAGEKIAFTREALRRLVDAMRDGDRLSLTTFETEAHQVFPSLRIPQDLERIRREIDNLHESGGTNMIAGLDIAYELARQNYDPEMVNRVLLFGDGAANVGDTDIETFANLTRINNHEGIYLSGVGVGADYEMSMMDRLTDAGKGAHVFLPNRAEVAVIFGPMLRKLIEVAADDISIEVSLPGTFYVQRFSGEELSTDPNHRVPNVVLAAGDDMTLLTRFRTTDPAAFDDDIEMTVHYRSLADGASRSTTHRVPLRDLVADPGLLLQRSQLIDRYARWAAAQVSARRSQSDEITDAGAEDLASVDDDSAIDPQALRAEIMAFVPQDPGLEEIACLLSVLDPQSPEYGKMEICGFDTGDYSDQMYGDMSSCAAMPVANGLVAVLSLMGLLILRRRRS